ncbi:hypothetical protein F7725_008697 [Dissostichus mawsoni]|uniref:TatD DNase domain containing 3 n=1 Tax=Dissostichus mawsoni TaxID=36200 RepID=A0A7J5Y7W8_DISMA|nr:hypothetical protein F7725_008697 [Dissostichus mawsoni]
MLAILAVAEHAGEFEKIIELSQRFPGFIFPCLGVHPVQGVSPEQQRGASLQVGLDFTPRFVRGETDKDVQRKVLIRVEKALLHAFDGKPSVAMEGVRNEPRNVVVSAEFISRVKGVSLQTVMDVTTQNALRLFPKITSKLRP